MRLACYSSENHFHFIFYYFILQKRLSYHRKTTRFYPPQDVMRFEGRLYQQPEEVTKRHFATLRINLTACFIRCFAVYPSIEK